MIARSKKRIGAIHMQKETIIVNTLVFSVWIFISFTRAKQEVNEAYSQQKF